MICGPIALSKIKKYATRNATKKHKILKKEFDLHTVTIYSLFHCQIFKYKLKNHKTFQEYDKSVIKAKKKLVKLRNLLPKLAVICAFFDGFDIS